MIIDANLMLFST